MFLRQLKGQISVFIILITIILILGVVLFLFQNENVELIQNQNLENVFNSESNSKISTISDYVEFCLLNSTQISILENLKQGGFENVPNYYIPYLSYQIPIYLEYQIKHIPSISVIERELENSMLEPFTLCIDDFNTFKSAQYNISYSSPSFQSSIENDSIISQANFPLSIIESSQSNTLNINEFESELQSDILNYYNIIEDFINYNLDNNIKGIPTIHLNIISYKYNFTYEVLPQNSEIIVYNFVFDNSIDNYINYQFAVMYNLSEGNEE